jgi:hypothetical protein
MARAAAPPPGSRPERGFRFTGKIAKITFKLGPEQLTSDQNRVIQHALAKARD